MIIGYILYNEAKNQAVAIDMSSGGYPWMTNVRNCKIFETAETALDYYNGMSAYIPTCALKAVKIDD